MSNSPIFDRMAAERGYARLTAARTIPVPVEPQGAVQPDPILDSPVPLAPEEEVYVRPFTKVEGVPRGLASTPRSTQDIPLEDVTIERVTRVDLTTQEQFEAHRAIWAAYVDERVDHRNRAYMSVVEASRSIALINIAEGEKHKRVEYSFNPLDMEEAGLSFTDFAHAVVEGFRRGYPEVKDYRFSTKHADEFDNREIFIVEEVIKVTPDTVKDIKPGDNLEIQFPKGSRKPTDGVLSAVQAAFRHQYPEHVMVAVKAIQEHEDGSATLTVEGQSILPVKPVLTITDQTDGTFARPLSEMETAPHTE